MFQTLTAFAFILIQALTFEQCDASSLNIKTTSGMYPVDHLENYKVEDYQAFWVQLQYVLS